MKTKIFDITQTLQYYTLDLSSVTFPQLWTLCTQAPNQSNIKYHPPLNRKSHIHTIITRYDPTCAIIAFARGKFEWRRERRRNPRVLEIHETRSTLKMFTGFATAYAHALAEKPTHPPWHPGVNPSSPGPFAVLPPQTRILERVICVWGCVCVCVWDGFMCVCVGPRGRGRSTQLILVSSFSGAKAVNHCAGVVVGHASPNLVFCGIFFYMKIEFWFLFVVLVW